MENNTILKKNKDCKEDILDKALKKYPIEYFQMSMINEILTEDDSDNFKCQKILKRL